MESLSIFLNFVRKCLHFLNSVLRITLTASNRRCWSPKTPLNSLQAFTNKKHNMSPSSKWMLVNRYNGVAASFLIFSSDFHREHRTEDVEAKKRTLIHYNQLKQKSNMLLLYKRALVKIYWSLHILLNSVFRITLTATTRKSKGCKTW